MARLAVPAIRAAIQTRLGTLLASERVGVRAAVQSDGETDLSRREQGETMSEAAYPYTSIAVEPGEIESGLRGSPTRGSILVRVLVWGRRGEEGELARQIALAEAIAGSLDAWSHTETGLRWSAARLREVEEYSPQEGGPGLDGVGAMWEFTVNYC